MPVRIIIGNGAEKQMIRVYATAHIAMMADAKTARDRTTIAFIGEAVRQHPSGTAHYSNVAALESFTLVRPQPAPGIRLRRNAGFKVNASYHFRLHRWWS